MDFEIRAVDLRTEAEKKAVRAFLADIFPFQLTDESVRLNTETDSRLGKPLYLGAFVGDELIGFNAYIAHDCHWQGERRLAYQSCWSGVARGHRGKKVFFELQRAAREPLRQRGALGIIGLPNERSGPILTGPLGYEPHGGYLRTSLLMPGWRLPLAKGVEMLSTPADALFPDPHQLLRLKQQQPDRHILSMSDAQGNLIWGKFAKVKKGPIRLRHFLVGGLDLAEPGHLPRLLQDMARKHRIRLMSFVYHHSSTYHHLFKKSRPSDSGYLCWYPLNVRAGEITKFDLLAGLSDVF
jgi:hypothetical protein